MLYCRTHLTDLLQLLPEGSSQVGHPGLGGPAGLYRFWLSFIVWWNQSIQTWLFMEKHQLQVHRLKFSFPSEHFRCFGESLDVLLKALKDTLVETWFDL